MARPVGQRVAPSAGRRAVGPASGRRPGQELGRRRLHRHRGHPRVRLLRQHGLHAGPRRRRGRPETTRRAGHRLLLSIHLHAVGKTRANWIQVPPIVFPPPTLTNSFIALNFLLATGFNRVLSD